MWGRITVLCALTCVVISAPLTTTPLCPESCDCEPQTSGHLEIRCTSLNFLEKLQPKQVNAIVSLDLSHQNLTHLHSKLKKLRNLKRVDLSYNHLNDVAELGFLPKLTYVNLQANHIKYFTATSLPKHLTKLDISHNYLTYIPNELKNQQFLKQVDLYENPISCSCDTVNERDLLIKAGVILVKPVTCHSPEKLRGQLLQAVGCTESNDDLLDRMQGDDPAAEEGSGHESEVDIFSENSEGKLAGIEDEGLIPQSPTATASSEDVGEEGSGFGTESPAEEEEDDYYEGSGVDEDYDTTTMIPLRACNFECSSQSPPVANVTGEPDPDIIDEIRKVFNLDEAATTETAIIEVPTPTSDGEKEKMGITDANVVDEKTASWNTNLIIVIALIVIMMCLVVFSILRKRKKRRNAQLPNEQELKPLQPKPTNGGSNIPEKLPLMNGQNGNMNGKPVEEPVTRRRNEELDSKAPPEDEVNLRKKKDEESLLPETHRVTIQAKELSTPKTPLLVTRSRTDDGKFITTPEP